MQPNHFDLLGHGRDGAGDTRQQLSRDAASRSESAAQRLRSEDSWIEISSQPSSSSLSSAAADDVVTTGLRVQHDSNSIRRGRLTQNLPSGSIPSRRMSTAGSSQDEYEESESESDRVMNSSNEDISPQPHPVVRRTTSETSDAVLSDDDDGNSTALGLVSDERVFTPQPNAFSHPPISSSNRSAEAAAPSSYFPQASSFSNQSTTQRHSYPSHRTRSHTPFNVISPSHQTDHDAALRASLSTLLSCAAAARGLPKRDQPAPTLTAGGNRIEPTTLRMVPESVLMGEEEPPLPVRRISHRTTGSSSSASISVPTKGKRKASTSKDRRAPKKSRKATMDDMITPTMMTWVISASVVVLFSAISFSAGYAFGMEVGRSEAGALGAGEGVSCGKEVMKGSFRKLRWGPSSSASVRV